MGDVTARSAVLWTRADRAATLNVTLSGGGHGPVPRVQVVAEDDFTGRVPLTRLRPGTTYDYRVWFSLGAPGRGHGPAVNGSFRTAPAADDPAAVRLAFGGDVAGQNVCRDAQEGFPIMDTIRAWQPDVFVGLGDMIYADNACETTGRYGNPQLGGVGIAVDQPSFWAHWRYNRGDSASQRLLAGTSYVGAWDDHEVVNDFGPLTDAPTTPPYSGAHLLPLGLEAFLDYTPIETAPTLYRSLRWGRHLELFVLDTRRYRDANFAPDTGVRAEVHARRGTAGVAEGRTCKLRRDLEGDRLERPDVDPDRFPADERTRRLGRLRPDDRLRTRAARHPSVPTGTGNRQLDLDHDGRALRRGIPLSTVRRRPPFTVHELATGPLNAGIFPNVDFDTTLNPERLFFFGPESAGAVTTWTEAKRWFNFGTLTVRDDGTLTAGVVNTAGESVYSLELAP